MRHSRGFGGTTREPKRSSHGGMEGNLTNGRPRGRGRVWSLLSFLVDALETARKQTWDQSKSHHNARKRSRGRLKILHRRPSEATKAAVRSKGDLSLEGGPQQGVSSQAKGLGKMGKKGTGNSLGRKPFTKQRWGVPERIFEKKGLGANTEFPMGRQVKAKEPSKNGRVGRH